MLGKVCIKKTITGAGWQQAGIEPINTFDSSQWGSRKNYLPTLFLIRYIILVWQIYSNHSQHVRTKANLQVIFKEVIIFSDYKV